MAFAHAGIFKLNGVAVRKIERKKIVDIISGSSTPEH
jgi:hypothetical protein